MEDLMNVKLNLIAATCENNMGIGLDGFLPWDLKNKDAYFGSMSPPAQDPKKQNAVIMGRVTWDSIPPKYKPFTNRFNIVITENPSKIQKKGPPGFVCAKNLVEAMKLINRRDDIESTWVIGGGDVFEAAIELPNCDKIFLTRIQKYYECDVFFPKFDMEHFRTSGEPAVVNPENVVEEGVYRYTEIYKRVY